MKRVVAQALLSMIVLTCVGLAAAQEPAATRPAKFSAADFRKLRWIEGDWKGTGGADPFYERYRVVSPTRIEIEYYPDAQFSKPNADKGVVFLEAGAIVHEAGRGRWTATSVTGDSITFEPARNASNGFTWTRKTRDEWVAVLRPRAGAETTYQMTRVAR